MKSKKPAKLAMTIAVIAISAFVLFASCKGETDSGTPQENTTVASGNTENMEEIKQPEPDIPVIDMKGKEFRILTSGWWTATPMEIHDLSPEEILGEPLNDAAYNRKIRIEDTYNCKIMQIPGAFSPYDDITELQKLVRAGDPAYDITMLRGIYFNMLLTKNHFIDLNDLEYIDFDNPWWNRKCSDALRLGEKQIGISGNLSIVEKSLTGLVCFNKDIIRNYNLESPYDFVKNGEWTFDKLTEMAKSIARDLNGNGTMDPEDMWGITYQRDHVWNILNGCGVKMIEADADGFPQITLDAGDNLSKIQNIFIKLFDESYSANGRRIGVPFYFEKVLFQIGWAIDVTNFRVYDFDFGIVPLPKYDKAQKEYLSNVYGLGVPLICVPITNADMENTGLLMEVLSYEGQKSIVPIYYENILKTKSARDSESEGMIDYIFENLQYEMGTLINFGNFTQDICEMADVVDTNIASFVEKNRPRLEKEIQTIMKTIEKNN